MPQSTLFFERQDHHGSLWPRCEAYRIHNGAIVSSSGKFVYQDLELVPKDRRQRIYFFSYVPLLNLARQLNYPVDAMKAWMPDESGQKLIVEFCHRVGLLGVVPARYRTIVLPPDWFKASLFGEHIRRRYIPASRRYILSGGLWSETIFPILSSELDELPDKPGMENEPVPKSIAERAPPTTTIWKWEQGEWSDADLRTLLPFFPGLDSLQGIPLPGSVAFWRKYAEPVWSFCRWAELFRQAVEILREVPLKSKGSHRERLDRAFSFMKSLADTIGQQVYIKDGHLERKRACPSLLSFFADMFLTDLEQGRNVLVCERCQSYFVSSDSKARYCSSRCRNTMQRRRQRERAI